MVDLFAISLSKKLLIYISPVPNPVARKDAFQHQWAHLTVYTFPHFTLTRQVINKGRSSTLIKMILMAPLPLTS